MWPALSPPRNHHLSAIEERLMIEAPPEKLAIDWPHIVRAAE
jgi:hypothetical protein